MKKNNAISKNDKGMFEETAQQAYYLLKKQYYKWIDYIANKPFQKVLYHFRMYIMR